MVCVPAERGSGFSVAIFGSELCRPTLVSPLCQSNTVGVRTLGQQESVRRTNVAGDLDAILRSAFDRYAALESSGAGVPETLQEGLNG